MRSVCVGLVAVLFAITGAGCRSKRVIVEMRSDSVAVRVVHTERIDTVVARLPAEGVAGLMPAGCRESVVETSVAVSRVAVRADGVLEHTIRNKPSVKVAVVSSRDSVMSERCVQAAMVTEKRIGVWERFRSLIRWWPVGAVVAALAVVALRRRRNQQPV